jgi:hypothetical protein
MEGIMEHAVEMGTAATIYILSLIKIGLRHSDVDGGGGCTDTQIAWRSHKPALIFFFSKYRDWAEKSKYVTY